jgi:hypothetical protein
MIRFGNLQRRGGSGAAVAETCAKTSLEEASSI